MSKNEQRPGRGRPDDAAEIKRMRMPARAGTGLGHVKQELETARPIESAIRPAANSYERYLFQVGEMPYFVGFSVGGLDLLNRRLCRQYSAEIFAVDASKSRRVR